mmetsp:Transcript_47932/g.120965  ORF Transcript_47932/g.120965 Transcript_47932/m.120965 type:complete len:437 (-) Transcript_47932:1060-2370(-)
MHTPDGLGLHRRVQQRLHQQHMLRLREVEPVGALLREQHQHRRGRAIRTGAPRRPPARAPPRPDHAVHAAVGGVAALVVQLALAPDAGGGGGGGGVAVRGAPEARDLGLQAAPAVRVGGGNLVGLQRVEQQAEHVRPGGKHQDLGARAAVQDGQHAAHHRLQLGAVGADGQHRRVLPRWLRAASARSFLLSAPAGRQHRPLHVYVCYLRHADAAAAGGAADGLRLLGHHLGHTLHKGHRALAAHLVAAGEHDEAEPQNVLAHRAVVPVPLQQLRLRLGGRRLQRLEVVQCAEAGAQSRSRGSLIPAKLDVARGHLLLVQLEQLLMRLDLLAREAQAQAHRGHAQLVVRVEQHALRQRHGARAEEQLALGLHVFQMLRRKGRRLLHARAGVQPRGAQLAEDPAQGGLRLAGVSHHACVGDVGGAVATAVPQRRCAVL